MEKTGSIILQKARKHGQKPFLAAIDGRCAAGKTTLAEWLQKETGCPVIHMDHFFLRREQRSRQRLLEPGGNVDYERFLSEVMIPLSRGQEFSYRPFDCKTMELSAPVAIKPSGLSVIEGSYCCHPVLWDFYDLRVFLHVEPEEQLRRIIIFMKWFGSILTKKRYTNHTLLFFTLYVFSFISAMFSGDLVGNSNLFFFGYLAYFSNLMTKNESAMEMIQESAGGYL